MKEIKLLYQFGCSLGIYFPVGTIEEGGSCEFSSVKCRKECIAFKNIGKNTKIIPYKDKKEVYDFFCRESVSTIVRKLLSELEENSDNILSWFASGDCPSFLTKKISQVMMRLLKLDVIQCGFTRNIELYNRLYRKKEILYGGDTFSFISDLRVVLTVENKENIKEIGTGVENEKILIAIPNYKNGKSEIFIHQFDFDPQYCCYSNNESTTLVSEENYNCKECYEKKIGCFVKI